MPSQDALVFAFLSFLLTFGALLVCSVRRGRALCDELARRLPEQYVSLGQPRPGFWNSPGRSAYLRMLMQREFTELDDPRLVDGFEAQRRAELAQLVAMLAGFAVLGVAALWYGFFRSG